MCGLVSKHGGLRWGVGVKAAGLKPGGGGGGFTCALTHLVPGLRLTVVFTIDSPAGHFIWLIIWSRKQKTVGRPPKSVIIWRVGNEIQKSTFLTNGTYKQKAVDLIKLLFLILQVVPCGQMVVKTVEQGVQRFIMFVSMRQEWKIWPQQMIISIID